MRTAITASASSGHSGRWLLEAPTAEAERIVNDTVRRNGFAILWSRMFMVGSRRPDSIGAALWPIAIKQQFLTSYDTGKGRDRPSRCAISARIATHTSGSSTSSHVVRFSRASIQKGKRAIPGQETSFKRSVLRTSSPTERGSSFARYHRLLNNPQTGDRTKSLRRVAPCSDFGGSKTKALTSVSSRSHPCSLKRRNLRSRLDYSVKVTSRSISLGMWKHCERSRNLRRRRREAEWRQLWSSISNSR